MFAEILSSDNHFLFHISPTSGQSSSPFSDPTNLSMLTQYHPSKHPILFLRGTSIIVLSQVMPALNLCVYLVLFVSLAGLGLLQNHLRHTYFVKFYLSTQA